MVVYYVEMTERPGIGYIPYLRPEILDGLVQTYATELSRGLCRDPLEARSFIISSNKHLRTRLRESEQERERCADILGMIRSLVPTVFIPDSQADIDDIVEWLDQQGITQYGFIYHKEVNHFIFSSWDDAALTKLRWI